MSQRPTRSRRHLLFEPLEGRALMSATGLRPTATPHFAPAAQIAHLRVPRIGINSMGPGRRAVIDALLGGAGHEFVALALREVKNPLGVAAGISSGAMAQYSVPGLVVKKINWQSGYTGPLHDVLALNFGGAVLLRRRQIELGAIVRGPFTTTPFPTTVVFAIDRGAGGRLGPYYSGRPGITPDALVTVQIGPNGVGNSATLTDLTNGSTQPLSSAVVRVAGPTVRVLFNSRLLPSQGFRPNRYTFAVWTATGPNAPFQNVGSFVPENGMDRIGVESNMRPTI